MLLFLTENHCSNINESATLLAYYNEHSSPSNDTFYIYERPPRRNVGFGYNLTVARLEHDRCCTCLWQCLYTFLVFSAFIYLRFFFSPMSFILLLRCCAGTVKWTTTCLLLPINYIITSNWPLHTVRSQIYRILIFNFNTILILFLFEHF